jgi:hypothetical protein
MWGLIIAGSVGGLLLGPWFRVYALIPVFLLLTVLAGVLAGSNGWAIGAISLLMATFALQLCYFVAAGIALMFEVNSAVADALFD